MTPAPQGNTLNSKLPRSADLGSFDIRSTTRSPLPRLAFEEIARAILGRRYDLSLVICGDTLARRINQSYRHKDYSPNILSFPLDKNSGEIFLNIRKAEREAKQMGLSVRLRIAHLYVHGCFHLLGMEHSEEMERREDIILSRFGLI